MKKMICYALIFCLFCCALPLGAFAETQGGPVFMERNGYAALSFYRNPTGVVEIPSEYNGLPVREIGADAFFGNEAVEGIILPNTITIVGDRAFSECTGLQQLVLPQTATVLGKELFKGCISLQRVEMPSLVQTLNDSLFEGCVALQEVILPVSVASVSGKNTFLGCESLKSVELFEGMEEIPNGFFKGCSALKEISFPDSIEQIREESFMGCSSLEKIECPQGLKRITTASFKDCTALKEVILSPAMVGIGYYAFENCTALTTVQWPLELLDLANAAFRNCVSLTELNLPETDLIRESVFEGCTGLTYVELPAGVKRIEARAFANCTNLEGLKANGEILQIGADVLLGTAYYNNPENWKENGLYWGTVLMDAKPITAKVFTPLEGTTAIASGVFGAEHMIRTIIIPDKVTYVGEFAMEGCTALKTLVVGKNVSFSGYVIYNCPGLTSLYWEQEGETVNRDYLQLYNNGTSYQIVGDGQGEVYHSVRRSSRITYLDVHNITKGDPNADGTVTAADALLMLKATVEVILPYGTQADAMDMNGDGKINALDALQTLRRAVGKE